MFQIGTNVDLVTETHEQGCRSRCLIGTLFGDLWPTFMSQASRPVSTGLIEVYLSQTVSIQTDSTQALSLFSALENPTVPQYRNVQRGHLSGAPACFSTKASGRLLDCCRVLAGNSHPTTIRLLGSRGLYLRASLESDTRSSSSHGPPQLTPHFEVNDNEDSQSQTTPIPPRSPRRGLNLDQ
jgi:hypothetical protein